MPLILPATYSPLQTIRPSLSADARTVVHDSYVKTVATAAATVGGPPQEPDYVAELVHSGVAALAAKWRPLLAPHGLSLQIIGVFTHQSPMVEFTGPTGTLDRCELGDLLLAVRFPGASGTPGVASLVQAKMSTASVATIAGSDPKQHHLYSTWPDLDLWRTSFKSIDIQSSGEQGFLGEIESVGPTAAAPPSQRVWQMEDFLGTTAQNPLEDLFADLAAGQVGREFYPFTGPRPAPPFITAPSAQDEWNFLIDYLLNVTFLKVYARARTGVFGRPRGGIVTAFADKTTQLIDGDFSLGIWPRLLQGATGWTARDRWCARTAKEFALRSGGGFPGSTSDDPFEDRGKGFGIILIDIR